MLLDDAGPSFNGRSSRGGRQPSIPLLSSTGGMLRVGSKCSATGGGIVWLCGAAAGDDVGERRRLSCAEGWLVQVRGAALPLTMFMVQVSAW